MSTAVRFSAPIAAPAPIHSWAPRALRDEPSAAEDASMDLRELGRLVQREGPVSSRRAVRVVRRAARAMGEAHESGRHADVRNHVHSLGVALFFVLTGRAPFETTSGWPPVARIEDSPPSPSAYAPHPISPSLDAIVRTCLARRPADRFGSMQELSAALAAIPYAENEPFIDAPPASGVRQSQRPAARQRQSLPPLAALASQGRRQRVDSLLPPSMEH